jgi:hypothetical protein
MTPDPSTPIPRTTRARRRPLRLGALALGAACSALLFGLAGAGAAAPSRSTDVPAAQAALQQARSTRSEAERRLAALTAEQAALVEEVRRLDEGAAIITDELAAARREVREFAIAAYIDGGQSRLIAASLDPADSAALAWRSQLMGGQVVDAADAADRYRVLQEINDPERIAAAARLDQLNATLEEAQSDALQAAALERDAEHVLADAEAEAEAAARAAAEQARRAEEERRAAQAEQVALAEKARQAETARQQRAVASPPAPPAPSAPPPTTPAPTPPSSGIAGATQTEQAQLAKIRWCESRGNYQAVSSSGRYRGAYQFDQRTWESVGGRGDPAAAPPAEQDARALQLLRTRGPRAWPNCA